MKCFPENRLCLFRVEGRGLRKGHKCAYAGILWLRRRRQCAREPGEGVERWPREMRQTQTSWLPRPSPVSYRAQGGLWRPAPFNFLVPSDPCTQTHCQASGLPPSCGLSTVKRAQKTPQEKRAGCHREPHIYSEVTLNSSGPREGGKGGGG